MNGSQTGGWLILAAFAAVPVVLFVAGLRGLARDRKRLPGWLREQGYQPLAIQARYLTSGPFEHIRTPGTKHGDQLYRVLASDHCGVQQVLWIRVPAGLPGHAPPWELRRDDAPERTRRGLSEPAFCAMALTLAFVAVSLIAAFSRALRP